MKKSKYYLFLDESGHHGLKTISQEFPIFLLCGCILESRYFHKEFTQKFNKLKTKYFKSTEIIFHSRDIRKWQKEFKILGNIKIRHNFYQDLDRIISQAKFTIVASAILKDELIKLYGPRANNPYDLCLSFILERATFYLDLIDKNSEVKVVAEARGKREDAKLQAQYQLIISNGTNYVDSDRFRRRFKEIEFVKKKENNLGTQLADLVAYPIATKIIYPNRENLAFRIIESKIYRQFPNGDYLGYGLKVFP